MKFLKMFFVISSFGILATSCGNIESDAKKVADFMCKTQKGTVSITDAADLALEVDKLKEKYSGNEDFDRLVYQYMENCN